MFWNIVQILGRGYLNWIEDIFKELYYVASFLDASHFSISFSYDGDKIISKNVSNPY